MVLAHSLLSPPLTGARSSHSSLRSHLKIKRQSQKLSIHTSNQHTFTLSPSYVFYTTHPENGSEYKGSLYSALASTQSESHLSPPPPPPHENLNGYEITPRCLTSLSLASVETKRCLRSVTRKLFGFFSGAVSSWSYTNAQQILSKSSEEISIFEKGTKLEYKTIRRVPSLAAELFVVN